MNNSILFKATKTLLLDYAIQVFFGRILINMSDFDVLNGIREFKRLKIEGMFCYYGGDVYLHNVKVFFITSIKPERYSMMVRHNYTTIPGIGSTQNIFHDLRIISASQDELHVKIIRSYN